MKLERRTATVNDEEFVHNLHHEAYRDVVCRQFGEWDISRQDKFFEEKWNPKKFQILLCDGTPCGFLSVEDRSDHIFLSEVVILPAYQGRGIGSQIIDEEMQRALDSGLPVRLQVLNENRAIKLYKKIGFREYGVTDTHIQMVWDNK